MLVFDMLACVVRGAKRDKFLVLHHVQVLLCKYSVIWRRNSFELVIFESLWGSLETLIPFFFTPTLDFVASGACCVGLKAATTILKEKFS